MKIRKGNKNYKKHSSEPVNKTNMLSKFDIGMAEDEQNVIKWFISVFRDNSGQRKTNLYLKEIAKQVLRPKHPVPFSAILSVEKELWSVERIGVPQTVSCSTWTAPNLVVRKQNGTIRLCRFYHWCESSLWRLQPSFTGFWIYICNSHGGTCSARLDTSEFYLLVEVEHECRGYRIINTYRVFINLLDFGFKRKQPLLSSNILRTISLVE